jgi:hypothetical protein
VVRLGCEAVMELAGARDGVYGVAKVPSPSGMAEVPSPLGMAGAAGALSWSRMNL